MPILVSLIGVFHRYTYIFHGYSGISVVFRYFGDSCDPSAVSFFFSLFCYQTFLLFKSVTFSFTGVKSLVVTICLTKLHFTGGGGWGGDLQTVFFISPGVVGWCEGVMYLTSLGRPTDIGLQLGKACYPCSR